MKPLRKENILGARGALILGTLAIIFIAFYGLGAGEIQSWDEAMYLVRARACLTFGAWIDQTSYACGGLYSASHPPLGIWIYAVTQLMSGTWISRLPSAIAYLASIWFLYQFLKIHLKQSAAILGCAALAAAQTYVLYAHRAQLDAMLIAWIMMSIYYYASSLQRIGKRDLYISGLALGCALMTKFGFGLVVLPFLVLYTPPKEWRKLLIVVSVAAVLALPWYLYMLLAHPTFGRHAGELISSAQYDALTSHPWYYYLNQCVVNIPLIVPALIVYFRGGFKTDRLLRAAFGWFAVTFMLLEAMSTKMPHFALLLFPSLCIIVAVAAERYCLERRSTALVVTSGIVALIWSASEQLRLLATHRILASQFLFPSWIVFALLAAGLIAIAFFRKQWEWSLRVAFGLLLLQSSRLLAHSESVNDSGAESVIAQIDSSHLNQGSVYTTGEPHAELVPQLAYYSNGATLGWDKNKSWSVHQYTDFRRSPSSVASAAIIERSHDRLAPVVDTGGLSTLRSNLSTLYSLRFMTRNYELYY